MAANVAATAAPAPFVLPVPDQPLKARICLRKPTLGEAMREMVKDRAFRRYLSNGDVDEWRATKLPDPAPAAAKPPSTTTAAAKAASPGYHDPRARPARSESSHVKDFRSKQIRASTQEKLQRILDKERAERAAKEAKAQKRKAPSDSASGGIRTGKDQRRVLKKLRQS